MATNDKCVLFLFISQFENLVALTLRTCLHPLWPSCAYFGPIVLNVLYVLYVLYALYGPYVLDVLYIGPMCSICALCATSPERLAQDMVRDRHYIFDMFCSDRVDNDVRRACSATAGCLNKNISPLSFVVKAMVLSGIGLGFESLRGYAKLNMLDMFAAKLYEHLINNMNPLSLVVETMVL